MKKRLKEEGANQLLTNCKQLKMRAEDGKNRLTDVARKGGEVAGIARKALEERTGKSVISEKKAVELNTVFTKMIEEVSSEDLKEV